MKWDMNLKKLLNKSWTASLLIVPWFDLSSKKLYFLCFKIINPSITNHLWNCCSDTLHASIIQDAWNIFFQSSAYKGTCAKMYSQKVRKVLWMLTNSYICWFCYSENESCRELSYFMAFKQYRLWDIPNIFVTIL